MGKKTLPTGRRMVKGKQWVSSYTGQHIVKAYRKQFGVDRMTAINDLHSIGVIDDQEFERLRKTEEERIATLRKQREEKALEAWQKTHEDQDSRFYFTLMLLSLSAAIAQGLPKQKLTCCAKNTRWTIKASLIGMTDIS